MARPILLWVHRPTRDTKNEETTLSFATKQPEVFQVEETAADFY